MFIISELHYSAIHMSKDIVVIVSRGLDHQLLLVFVFLGCSDAGTLLAEGHLIYSLGLKFGLLEPVGSKPVVLLEADLGVEAGGGGLEDAFLSLLLERGETTRLGAAEPVCFTDMTRLPGVLLEVGKRTAKARLGTEPRWSNQFYRIE